MRRNQLLFLLFVTGIATSVGTGQELAEQVKESLRSNKDRAVHDLGKILKPQGVKELQELADRYSREDIHLHFVTLPKSQRTVDALAEVVYRELGMTARDVLIVFNGNRVYGKSLALDGEPESFSSALRQAAPGFKLYYAKGLSQFAQALHDRILQRRTKDAEARSAESKRIESERIAMAASVAEQQRAAVSRRRAFWAVAAVVILLAIGAFAYPRWNQNRNDRNKFDDRLQEAELVFQRVSLKMPDNVSEDINAEFVRQFRQLERCREREGMRVADLDRLVAGFLAIEDRLDGIERPTASGPSQTDRSSSQA